MNKYQTFLPRFLALVLDTILLLPLGIVEDSVKNSVFSDQLKLALIIALGLANVTYFIVMHTLFGQTVGKMLMKVKVLDVSESALKFRQALLRDLPQIIFIFGSLIFTNPLLLDEQAADSPNLLSNPYYTVILLWGIADIVVFFTNDKRRALHDFVAGSVVVKIETEESI